MPARTFLMTGRGRAGGGGVLVGGARVSAGRGAEKVAPTTKKSIVVVEAGDDVIAMAARGAERERYLAYGENPWPNDHIDSFEIEGPLQSRSMFVGGLAMHWGGVTPRFSPDDFRHRSIFGVGDDWPISYEDLDPFYPEAEELMPVAGKQRPPPMDPRSKPFPLPALPLTYNLGLLREWASKAGIATWSQPSAKNSVPFKNRPPCCRNDTCA